MFMLKMMCEIVRLLVCVGRGNCIGGASHNRGHIAWHTFGNSLSWMWMLLFMFEKIFVQIRSLHRRSSITNISNYVLLLNSYYDPVRGLKWPWIKWTRTLHHSSRLVGYMTAISVLFTIYIFYWSWHHFLKFEVNFCNVL